MSSVLEVILGESSGRVLVASLVEHHKMAKIQLQEAAVVAVEKEEHLQEEEDHRASQTHLTIYQTMTVLHRTRKRKY
eukprot:5883324-Amphidinium_carterae.3